MRTRNYFTLTGSELSGTIFDSELYAGAEVETFDIDNPHNIEDQELISGITDDCLYLFLRDRGNDPILAGRPYFVKWEKVAGYNDEDPAYDHCNPVFRNVTIDNTLTPITTNDLTVTLQSTYDPFERDYLDRSILFLGASNTLYYPSGAGTATIKPSRAYFQLNDYEIAEDAIGDGGDDWIPGGGGDAKGFVLSVDRLTVNGISATPATLSESKVISTLTGLQIDGSLLRNNVKGLKPGVYIVNGRKILVK